MTTRSRADEWAGHAANADNAKVPHATALSFHGRDFDDVITRATMQNFGRRQRPAAEHTAKYDDDIRRNDSVINLRL